MLIKENVLYTLQISSKNINKKITQGRKCFQHQPENRGGAAAVGVSEALLRALALTCFSIFCVVKRVPNLIQQN